MGPVLRSSILGTEATYRVISEDGATVTVEVIDAPGLTQGTRLRLMAHAVEAMERVDVAGAPNGNGRTRAATVVG